MTVIYGQNGSGKSGYARLLKQLCGSRSKDEIRPNVFSDEEHACSAQCRITIDGTPRDINWQPNAEPHPQLKHAQVFDSKAASQYMGKTESSYEPSSMRFITLLIQVSDKVSAELASEKAKLVSSLPQFPADLADTAGKGWLASLKASVSAEKIEAYCQFPKELDEERIKAEAGDLPRPARGTSPKIWLMNRRSSQTPASLQTSCCGYLKMTLATITSLTRARLVRI